MSDSYFIIFFLLMTHEKGTNQAIFLAFYLRKVPIVDYQIKVVD